MTTLDLKVNLSDKIVEHLQQEPDSRHISLNAVVGKVLADYLEEPTEAEILESLRIGMQQALAGDHRPALEVLDEIDREMMGDADDS